MKNVLTIMFCLLGMNSAFAQIELKGFLEGSYYQYDALIQQDSSSLYQKEKSFRLRPSFAASFYRIDRAFHELGISNIYFSNKDYDSQNGTTAIKTESNQASFNFRYNYNFCLLKEVKRWSPYVGLQTNHQFSWSGSEQGVNRVQSFGIQSRAGLAAGVQYKLKENFRLELQLPIDLVNFSYQRQNSVSSQVPNGQVRQFVDVNWVNAPLTFIPIRLGVVVQI